MANWHCGKSKSAELQMRVNTLKFDIINAMPAYMPVTGIDLQ